MAGMVVTWDDVEEDADGGATADAPVHDALLLRVQGQGHGQDVSMHEALRLCGRDAAVVDVTVYVPALTDATTSAARAVLRHLATCAVVRTMTIALHTRAAPYLWRLRTSASASVQQLAWLNELAALCPTVTCAVVDADTSLGTAWTRPIFAAWPELRSATWWHPPSYGHSGTYVALYEGYLDHMSESLAAGATLHLEEIDISVPLSVGPIVLGELVRLILRCPNLRRLSARLGPEAPPETIAPLAAALGRCSELRELWLDLSHTSRDAVSALVQGLSGLVHLEIIHVEVAVTADAEPTAGLPPTRVHQPASRAVSLTASPCTARCMHPTGAVCTTDAEPTAGLSRTRIHWPAARVVSLTASRYTKWCMYTGEAITAILHALIAGGSLAHVVSCDATVEESSLNALVASLAQHCPALEHLRLHGIAAAYGSRYDEERFLRQLTESTVSLCAAGFPRLRKVSFGGGRLNYWNDANSGGATAQRLCELLASAPVLSDIGCSQQYLTPELCRHLHHSSKRRESELVQRRLAGAGVDAGTGVAGAGVAGAGVDAGTSADAGTAVDAGTGAGGVEPRKSDDDGFTVGSLPTELVLRILECLAPIDLIQCRRVCVLWRDAVKVLQDRDRRTLVAAGRTCGASDLAMLPHLHGIQLDRPMQEHGWHFDDGALWLPCTCGALIWSHAHRDMLITGLLRGATTETSEKTFAHRHDVLYPVARWEDLAPDRCLACALAGECATTLPALRLILNRPASLPDLARMHRDAVYDWESWHANDWQPIPWLPAWIHLPSAVVRPTTVGGVRRLVAALMDHNGGKGKHWGSIDVNHVDRMFARLSWTAARQFYEGVGGVKDEAEGEGKGDGNDEGKGKGEGKIDGNDEGKGKGEAEIEREGNDRNKGPGEGDDGPDRSVCERYGWRSGRFLYGARPTEMLSGASAAWVSPVQAPDNDSLADSGWHALHALADQTVVESQTALVADADADANLVYRGALQLIDPSARQLSGLDDAALAAALSALPKLVNKLQEIFSRSLRLTVVHRFRNEARLHVWIGGLSPRGHLVGVLAPHIL